MLSIVIPVYGAPELLETLVHDVEYQTRTFKKEIILVIDGCPKDSWKKATKISLTSNSTRLVLIRLGRNIGQHRAIWEGLRNATGEKILVMDCDFQDDPEEIPNLLQYSRETDAVVGIRGLRRDKVSKRASSWLFWKIISFLTGKKIPLNTANFGVYSKDLISNIVLHEYNSPFFPLEVVNLAKKIKYVEIEHKERTSSPSGYNIYELIGLAIGVAISYSRRPFMFLILFSLFILSFAVLGGGYVFYVAVFDAQQVAGWASVVLSIAFFGSFNLIFLSVLGLYIVEIFQKSVNHKPILIAEKKTIAQ